VDHEMYKVGFVNYIYILIPFPANFHVSLDDKVYTRERMIVEEVPRE